MKKAWLILAALLGATALVLAQRGTYTPGESWVSDDAKNPREVESHSTGTPMWTNTPGFDKDTFTFARVRRGRFRGHRGGPWSTDTPDSDLNFSYRLQQMTSIKVNPMGKYIRLTDSDLGDYPFIYFVEPGSLYLTDEEIGILRKYLLNGGFMMMDDFWGEGEWTHASEVIKQVLPEFEWVELPLDHPLYHCVFEIKSKGQVPNVKLGVASEFDPNHNTSERGEESKIVHHRAIFDQKGHMMVLATHNTDNGDGWEREGESDYYFHNFSEKISYPLGINIVYYVMTH
jgi:hypothetical protein